MDNLKEAIIELNLLGSYIERNDSFKNFENKYLASLTDKSFLFENKKFVDFKALKDILKNSILSQVKNRNPVVFLSGGIDSTVLAHTLHINNLRFDACSYFVSENDPTIAHVEYLEKHYGIVSKKYFLNYSKLRNVYDNYFEYYQSPNIDYMCLSMCEIVNNYCNGNHQNGNITFIDGIEGDNLFGYNNTFKVKLKSQIMKVLSLLFSNDNIFNSRKANIYTSSLINDYSLNSLYQNFIFAKILNAKGAKAARKHINEIILKFNKRKLSFHSRNMIGMLYYMGRRVAYKNHHPIKKFNNNVIYPFIDTNMLKFGFELENNIKIKPVIKAPLKKYLEHEGYQKNFIYAPKRGMDLDLFKVISFDDVNESLILLSKYLEIKNVNVCKNYTYKLYKNRDKAVDHFLFGLAISGKYIKHKNG